MNQFNKETAILSGKGLTPNILYRDWWGLENGIFLFPQLNSDPVGVRWTNLIRLGDLVENDVYTKVVSDYTDKERDFVDGVNAWISLKINLLDLVDVISKLVTADRYVYLDMSMEQIVRVSNNSKNQCYIDLERLIFNLKKSGGDGKSFPLLVLRTVIARSNGRYDT